MGSVPTTMRWFQCDWRFQGYIGFRVRVKGFVEIYFIRLGGLRVRVRVKGCEEMHIIYPPTPPWPTPKPSSVPVLRVCRHIFADPVSIRGAQQRTTQQQRKVRASIIYNHIIWHYYCSTIQHIAEAAAMM